MQKSHPAFALIELLLVLGILAVLAGIVILAMNPGKQFAELRNAQRRNDLTTILTAVYQYQSDRGAFPPDIKATAKGICRTGAASCHNGVSLSLLSGSILPHIPSDPLASETGTGTDYTILKTRDNHITVSAPRAENGASLSETR